MREESNISIFDFSNFRDYLIQYGMPEGQYSHSSNNLKTWSTRLGYKSPSSLSMVIKGKRLPSQDMTQAIISDAKMGDREAQYFNLLIQLEKLKNKNKDTTQILQKITDLSGSKEHTVDLKEFSAIARWYFLPIKQLISTSSFIEDHDWICKRLRNKVTPGQVKYAIDTMLELGIIARDEEDKLFSARSGLTTTNDIPSSAIQKHHAGMLERGSEAIFEQDVSERQVSSVTLKVSQENIKDAKQEIFDFIRNFNDKYSTSETQDTEDIYQLNMQFFSLTKRLH